MIYVVLRSRGIDPIPLNPWYFPSISTYSKLLTSHGFTIKRIELEPRLTPLPGPLADWLHLFARNTVLKDMNDEEAQCVIEEIEEKLRVDHQDEEGKWAIMYCRLRFEAVLSDPSSPNPG